MNVNFDNIKKYILVSSKLLSIVICLYYIIQCKNYEVSWNLFRYFFPRWTSSIDIALSTVGTYILFIPLIIILASFIQDTLDENGKPEKKSMLLSTLSMLFGLGIVIISLVMQIIKGNLHEYIDLRFITIYKQLTLDAKRELFVNEFTQIVFNLHIKAQAKLEFLLLHVQEKYMNLFEKTLVKIPSTEIKGYAQRIVNELLISYDSYEKAQPGIWSKSITYIQNNVTLKGVLITVGICLAFYGVYYFGKSLNNDNLKQATDIHIEATKLNQTSHAVQASVLNENIQHVEASQDVVQGLSNLNKVVATLNIELGNTQTVVNTTMKTIQNHDAILNVITKHFPKKGQFEHFITFLANMYSATYAPKDA
jgi:hypothetical protein